MDKKYKTALLMVTSYSWWKLFRPRDLVIHYSNSALPSPSSQKRTGFVSGFRETAACQHHHPSRANARTSKTKPLPLNILSKENYITDITFTDKSESKTVTKKNFLNVSSFSSSVHFSLSPSFLWSATTCTSTLSSSFLSQPLNRPNYLPGSDVGTELWRNE